MIRLITDVMNKKALRTLCMSALPLICATLCSTPTARAEGATFQCTFGTCKVEITPENLLHVSCEDRSVYFGPYVVNTEYRTIRIQGANADSPRIVTQSLASSGIPNHATLFIAGQGIEGTCKFSSAPETDTLSRDF